MLAQIFAAATYPDQIPDAARWADQHHYLTGQALADAIQADQLPWDPSVQALLPFPSVLDMMASDMPWTTAIGNAFLAQQQDVMDAVQRERAEAEEYGYLRSNGAGDRRRRTLHHDHASQSGFHRGSVLQSGSRFLCAGAWFFVGGAIRFGFGVPRSELTSGLGDGAGGFARFDWGGHAVFVNNARWGRTWVNRAAYVHPYPKFGDFAPAARAPEGHAVHERSERRMASC